MTEIYREYSKTHIGWFPFGLTGWQAATVALSTMPVFWSLRDGAWASAGLFLVISVVVSVLTVVPVRGRSAVGWILASVAFATGGLRRWTSFRARASLGEVEDLARADLPGSLDDVVVRDDDTVLRVVHDAAPLAGVGDHGDDRRGDLLDEVGDQVEPGRRLRRYRGRGGSRLWGALVGVRAAGREAESEGHNGEQGEERAPGHGSVLAHPRAVRGPPKRAANRGRGTSLAGPERGVELEAVAVAQDDDRDLVTRRMPAEGAQELLPGAEGRRLGEGQGGGGGRDEDQEGEHGAHGAHQVSHSRDPGGGLPSQRAIS